MAPGLLLMIYAHSNIHLCPKALLDMKMSKMMIKQLFVHMKISQRQIFFRGMFWIICVSQHNWMKFQTERLLCLGCPEFSTQLSLTKGDAREAATSQRIRSAAAGQLPNSSPSTIEQLSWEFAQEKNPNWRSRHGRLCGVRLKRVQASQFNI